MSKKYAGQTSLRIRLTLGTTENPVDITGATVLQVKYKKPDGTTGNFTATSEQDSPNGIIYYDIQAGDIPATDFGEWTFWAYVTFADGRSAPGEAFTEMFYNEGE